MKIVVGYGTRPEIIKLAPIILELKRRRIECIIINTGQHLEMVSEVEKIFQIEPNFSLKIMQANQGLNYIVSEVINTSGKILEQVRPDRVLIQGDTSTVLGIGISSFHLNIPVGHVEAGLRSHSMTEPFPEEFNRRAVSLLASYHFAPTLRAKENLIKEGIESEKVFLTGNTIVDAVQEILSLPSEEKFSSWGKRNILITAHRRENLGSGILNICAAAKALAKKDKEITFFWPAHPNPKVKNIVIEELADIPNIKILPPLPFDQLIRLEEKVDIIWTDSGGIQEESASLKKPVLILRNLTERPEIIESGFGILVGTNPETIILETEKLLYSSEEYSKRVNGENPFGDGNSSKRIIDFILR